MHLFSAHKTKPARRQKADSVLQFLSICIIVLFCLLQSGDKRPRVNRKFATEPPSQTRIKSLKKKTKGNTSHCKPPPCGGPHRATLTPLKSKNNTFCNGGGRGDVTSDREFGAEVRARRTAAALRLLQTTNRHRGGSC